MVRRLFAIAFAVIVGLLGVASIANAQGKTEPDSEFGKGGTKTTNEVTNADGSKTWTATWKDAKGTIRKQSTDTLEKDGYLTEKDEWFDEQGKKIRQEVGKYDDWDYEDYWQEETYVDGVLESGSIWEWDKNAEEWVRKNWNKSTQRYEAVPLLRFDFLKAIGGFKKDVLIDDNFYVGGAIVIEDSFNSFPTYGFEVSYTHPLDKRIGIMGDFQWTRGSEDDITTYTKMQFLGGIALCQHVHNGWSLTPHVLGGVATVTPESGGQTFESTTAFSLAAGVDLGLRLNRKTEWIARADYNPTFNDGVQNNFRFSSGLRFSF